MNTRSTLVGSVYELLLCFAVRLRDHRKGRVKFTKGKRPVKMIFLKEFVNYSQAYQFEKKIKSWKKRVSIERMLSKSDNIADTI
ncbi:MAG: Excinuclease abc c subunit domain protein [Candidatus Woesebacteria bacterium GW2011_GWB1_38_8b]|uniref:Excinuclease abc c subunit domain protein n=1 Tax=Candidatus Woesebacteria bacterium GW2011_GWB1_38_8b TaxID=1618571 RepID=A0A0G0NPL5_9BACT|nr:MAG: Excinuclease abc c subunit domain protein [Candidatus Woesebacteria bacterium GW2011_GWB1_38_8b]